MVVMAKKRSADRHSGDKIPVQVRLHPVLHQQLDKLCERNMSTMTAEIVTALRKHLEAEGLWPPASK
jgi:hypothetical protein